jgi:acetyl/propionyl-CoA carboxylase alpha subunit
MQHIFTIDGAAAEAWLSRTDSGYRLSCEGARYDAALDLASDARGILHIGDDAVPTVIVTRGDTAWIHIDGAAHEIVLHDAILHHAGEAGGSAQDVIRAPMPGAVISVSVEAGSAVKMNDPLMIIESMKLETVIKASRDGIVEIVGFAAGQSFDRDAVLIQLVKED